MRLIRLSARWVLPVSDPPIRDGAVLVGADGAVAAVGPAAAVPLPAGAETLDLGEAALLPGFVNVHAHPELTGLRGLLEDLPFADWIGTLLRVKAVAGFGAADARAAARWTCVEAMAAGMTTLAATEDSGAALDALLEAGLRGVVYREVFGPAPGQAEPALAGLRGRIGAMRARATDRVRVGVSPHAPYTVSDALFAAVADLARNEALPVAVHAAESVEEQRLVVAGEGPFAERLRARGMAVAPRARSTIALLERVGLLAVRPLLIHCVTVDDADIASIAAAGAPVAHCPAANARLGHGTAPLARLRDAGVTVGLGSDSVAGNNRMDLLEEARLAQLLHRAGCGAAADLPARELIRLATLDGARCLGLDGRIGSIEPGKAADLCAIDLSGPHVRPVHDVEAAVIHAARGADTVLTMVEGRIVWRDGAPTTLAVGALARELEASAARLREARTRAHG
jgi:cytosine/adenosine deaminase-related metal-dependent hydrolase